MKVQVLPIDYHFVDRLLYTAARTCYSKDPPTKIFYDAASMSYEQMETTIFKALDAGHLSIAEHYQFNILIDGVSRALTHQLVRHRHCTYSMQSQRYCKFEDGFDYVMPDSIKQNDEFKQGFELAMTSLSKVYDVMLKYGVKAEDARYLFPNACTTNLVVSCNLHELMHICNERLCTCAQNEIRKLIMEIANQVIRWVPWTAKYLVPKCEKLGYCNEIPNRSCGKKPLKNNDNLSK